MSNAGANEKVSLDDPEFVPVPRPARRAGQSGPPATRVVERDIPYEIDDNGCYVWTGRLEEGYGVAKLFGKRHRAHRAVWLDTVGQIPSDLHLDHLCRNRACINPDHMEAVTPRENALRGEGPTAQMARRTHCKNGHEWTVETTRRNSGGGRLCGICKPRRVPAREKPHGTIGQYRAGCRCDPCREIENSRQREATARRRAARGLPPFIRPHEQPHGTRPRYRSGCRCDPCRQAESAAKYATWRGPRAGAK